MLQDSKIAVVTDSLTEDSDIDENIDIMDRMVPVMWLVVHTKTTFHFVGYSQ